MAALVTVQLRNEMLAEADVATAAAEDGDTFVNNANTMLAVRNNSESAIDVTMAKQRTTIGVAGIGDVTIADVVHSIPAGELAILNLPTNGYIDPATGRSDLTYDVHEDLYVDPIEFVNL